MHPDVIVVGGGIGGLTAAYALKRQGLAVNLLEQASEFGEVGAGIQLAPNCTRILHDFGLLDEVISLGVVPDSMVMRDAIDGCELTRLDLRDVRQRYGFPYVVIHRSDLHRVLLNACRRAGVNLATSQRVVGYRNTAYGAAVNISDASAVQARVVVAADGFHSVARKLLVDDEPVSSAYVAYRGTIPVAHPRGSSVDLTEVGVHVGPGCHFVHYGLRGGELLNQVAVFESPKARSGQADWGTPDELDEAFGHTCAFVREGLPFMWRDKWWRMFDRDPIMKWVDGNIALLGDAAHPPLQYIAQGAIMAIEDAWVLGEQVGRKLRVDNSVDWEGALAAYEAVRPAHCRRVLSASRAWGRLWHLNGTERVQRNQLLRERDIYDYSFVDWLYGATALHPSEEPPMFTRVALSSVDVSPTC